MGCQRPAGPRRVSINAGTTIGLLVASRNTINGTKRDTHQRQRLRSSTIHVFSGSTTGILYERAGTATRSSVSIRSNRRSIERSHSSTQANDDRSDLIAFRQRLTKLIALATMAQTSANELMVDPSGRPAAVVVALTDDHGAGSLMRSIAGGAV